MESSSSAQSPIDRSKNQVINNSGWLRAVCKQITDVGAFRTILSIERLRKRTSIYWRTIPSKLGLEICCLSEVHPVEDHPNRLELNFEVMSERMYDRTYEMAIVLEFQSEQECKNIIEKVGCSLADSLTTSRAESSAADPRRLASIIDFKLVAEQERVLQFLETMKRRDGAAVTEKFLYIKRRGLLNLAMQQWTRYVASANQRKMIWDKARWRLHAATNIDSDLQAWYHSAFWSEIYRLRGSFWFRDAVLPSYKESYGLVDNNLSPMEEAALSHILCSPGTTYGDVAGQMFTVQAMVGDRLYPLFTNLSSNGALAVKYPRNGRPSKKLFRFSFVEGSIYLTWKGKAGNTGVDLADVSHVIRGVQSEILKKKGADTMQNQFLSLFSTGRSVDLYFDTETECFDWFTLLEWLVNKEKKSVYELLGMEHPVDAATASEYDVLIHNSVVGLV